ncbi:MAG TPA: hypoxanthine phosphoribosyltransferase [Candidatus Limosilactobacillus faecipullorum]|nr:hypoxanthine phosphoribosyltransferase [Candidatus Limosilactobacillus faecipullorum]
MNNDIERVLYSEDQIQTRIAEMAKQIETDYADKCPVVISVLTGAILFTVDLLEKLDLYTTLDFIDVSSYFGGTESSGRVELVRDLKSDVKGKDILICEDIIDSGRTLQFLVDLLKERGAKSIKVATMLDKPEGRDEAVTVEADYAGFTVPNEFLVGYGLDYDGFYRNLPYVGILKPAVYTK